MRLTWLTLITAIALVLLAHSAAGFLGGWRDGVEGIHGGSNCAACTLLLGLVEQDAAYQNKSASAALAHLCFLLPDKWQSSCVTLVEILGPFIIDYIDNHETPDVICKALNICTGNCTLFLPPKEGITAAVERAKALLEHKGLAEKVKDLPPICQLPLFKEICDMISNFTQDHVPLDDGDKDYFGPLHTFRGADWRGKDCNDKNANHYPGRKPIDNDLVTDSNCNGIYGLDSMTGKPYEETLCGPTSQYGIIVLGDSATAHFHIPADYMNVTAWSKATFDKLIFAAENELDWPLFSSSTGFNDTRYFNPSISGPSNSTYQVIRSRNHCAHRDFQNIGVNGARYNDMNSTISRYMKRNPTTDYPAILVVSLIGNDVCNGHLDDYVAHMTTPAELLAQATDLLKFLNTQLPAGSHVILMGLANGSILYETMHNRIHPIGALRNDVTTGQVYDFLNCLQISPCAGWMNSNATLRDITTARAMELSDVLLKISLTQTYSNFDVLYVDNPIEQALEEWVAQGGQAWQLIEPVDGFHPSQWAQPLITDVIWRWLEANHTSALPPINPNNVYIEKVFGDQGGY